MAKKSDYKYPSYNALEIQLRKAKVPSPGKVASLLLETFFENAGELVKEDVSSRGLCGTKEGDFADWRKTLEGWLEWDYKRAKASGSLSRHFPGEKLVKYLNADIIKRQQVATAEQLYQGLAAKADRADIEALKAELAAEKSAREALEQRLAAFESREAHYLTALRNAAVLLTDTTDPGAIEACVKSMLNAVVEAEEDAAPSRTLLAN